jgi:hypothetical protein
MKHNLLNSVILIFAAAWSHSIYGSNPSSGDSLLSAEVLYDSRFQLTFGLFIPSITSTAQLNAPGGNVGATINLESAFKLPDTQNLFRFNGMYRFNNNHSVEGYFYQLIRKGTNVSRDSLAFGRLNIGINSFLNAHFKAFLFGGKYKYTVYNSESIEAGFAIGLSFLNISIGAEAELANRYIGFEEYNDLLFLPVFGFYNRLNITENLIFRNSLDMFALNIERYDGILFDFGVSLEYKMFNFASLGLSYNVFSLNVKFDTGETGRITYSHRGFMFFSKIYF